MTTGACRGIVILCSMFYHWKMNLLIQLLSHKHYWLGWGQKISWSCTYCRLSERKHIRRTLAFLMGYLSIVDFSTWAMSLRAKATENYWENLITWRDLAIQMWMLLFQCYNHVAVDEVGVCQKINPKISITPTRWECVTVLSAHGAPTRTHVTLSSYLCSLTTDLASLTQISSANETSSASPDRQVTV